MCYVLPVALIRGGPDILMGTAILPEQRQPRNAEPVDITLSTG